MTSAFAKSLRLGTPKVARHPLQTGGGFSRLHWFAFATACRVARLPGGSDRGFPSQRRLLPPSFPTGWSPFPRSDITTVATEQAPPMGLSPIGTSASIAAQAPSLRQNYPASSVLRASPPSQSARPFSHELPVDPHRDHRWDFPCCVWSTLLTCRRQYPSRSDGTRSLAPFHQLRPSP